MLENVGRCNTEFVFLSYLYSHTRNHRARRESVQFQFNPK